MKIYRLGLVFLLGLVIWSCAEKEEPVDDLQISDINLTSDYVYEIMKEFYLWNDHLPESVDLSQSIFDVLEDCRYIPMDKWSYIESTEAHKAYFQDGKYTGYGFGFSTDSVGNVRITFVFDSSPLKAKGVKRGWIINAIDNTQITSISQINDLLSGDEPNHDFTFIDQNGMTQQFTFTPTEITQNTVLLDTILNIDEKKIGYLVFKGFIEISEDELLYAFHDFKQANIDELIVDLRYNGGGLVNIGLLLGGLIGGDKVEDKIMVQYEHNNNLVDENKAYGFTSNINSINLDRAFFITTGGTASASEMVINGLKPYMDVILVGDNTHGKPVGMYSWSFKDYTVVPITFQITNAMSEGDYFDGIPVDALVRDDITKDFGDSTELCLKETLHYIIEGEFSPYAGLRSAKPEKSYPKGLRFEIGAY